MTLRKIISGGQTGVDQGALHGAQLAGVATGGIAARGWTTEDGSAEELLRGFNLRECSTPGYRDRTRQNVLQSDATLLIGNAGSPGSRLTEELCDKFGKPHMLYPWPSHVPMQLECVALWVGQQEIRVLNVAGNRESRNPGISRMTKRLILQLCGAVNGI